jgi:hypothetical protein
MSAEISNQAGFLLARARAIPETSLRSSERSKGVVHMVLAAETSPRSSKESKGELHTVLAVIVVWALELAAAKPDWIEARAQRSSFVSLRLASAGHTVAGPKEFHPIELATMMSTQVQVQISIMRRGRGLEQLLDLEKW